MVFVFISGVSLKYIKEFVEKVDKLIEGDFVVEVDRFYQVRRKK